MLLPQSGDRQMEEQTDGRGEGAEPSRTRVWTGSAFPQPSGSLLGDQALPAPSHHLAGLFSSPPSLRFSVGL